MDKCNMSDITIAYIFLRILQRADLLFLLTVLWVTNSQTKIEVVSVTPEYPKQGRIQEVADRGGGEASESLILAPWSNAEDFFPRAPLGRPRLCLNGAPFVMLIYLFLSLYLSFPLFPLFFFPSFSFFGAPLVTGGGKARKKTPGYAPAQDSGWVRCCYDYHICAQLKIAWCAAPCAYLGA